MNILEEIPETTTPQTKSFFSSNGPSSGPSASTCVNSNNSSHSGITIEPATNSSSPFNGSIFDFRNSIIVLLLLVVALTYFGINLLSLVGYGIQKMVDIISPFLTHLLDFMGYSTGSAINTAADISADVAKEGVDIAEGAIQNVGNLLIGDEAIGQAQQGSNKMYSGLQEPSPDASENPIQKSLTSNKTKWCLAGEYQDKRGCINLSESDNCMSGQIFPSEEMCLNPTLSNNHQ